MAEQNAGGGPYLNVGVVRDAPLFEINLVAERAEKLRRRQRLEIWTLGAALVILAIAAVFLLQSVRNVTKSWKSRNVVRMRESQIHRMEQERTDIERFREAVAMKVEKLVSLAPLAERRVLWAPKLAALAEALPESMGIAKLRADSGELFVASHAGAKKKGATRRRRHKTSAVPALNFSVIYLPPGLADPISRLLDPLRNSDAFMQKMDFIRMEQTEEGIWQGVPVTFFRGLAKGAEREQ